MALLGKKKTEFRMMHYEGLDEFPNDYGVNVVCETDQIIIQLYKQSTSVILPVTQLIDIEILPNIEFMQKYKNTVAPSNGNLSFSYYVFKYMSSSGDKKQFVLRSVGNFKATHYFGQLRLNLAKKRPQASYIL